MLCPPPRRGWTTAGRSCRDAELSSGCRTSLEIDHMRESQNFVSESPMICRNLTAIANNCAEELAEGVCSAIRFILANRRTVGAERVAGQLFVRTGGGR